MTIETYKFTDASMFLALKNFCIIHSVNQEDFYAAIPKIISRQIIFDNQTVSSGHSFKVNWDHPLCHPLAEYLDLHYSFDSRIEKMIGIYDDLFNKNPRKQCYHTNGYYVFDTNEKLKKVYTFEFTEPAFGDDYMMLLEFEDTDLNTLECRIFDYYSYYFGKNDTPEELKKPLSLLSTNERSVLRMIHI